MGGNPFEEYDNFYALIFAVNSGKRPPFPPNFQPHEIQILIEKCWHQNPNERPSLEDIQKTLEKNN